MALGREHIAVAATLAAFGGMLPVAGRRYPLERALQVGAMADAGIPLRTIGRIIGISGNGSVVAAARRWRAIESWRRRMFLERVGSLAERLSNMEAQACVNLAIDWTTVGQLPTKCPG